MLTLGISLGLKCCCLKAISACLQSYLIEPWRRSNIEIWQFVEVNEEGRRGNSRLKTGNWSEKL